MHGAMEGMELPEAVQQHRLEELQVWMHAIAGARTAVLPPHTQHPNPLVVGDLVIASVFSTGTVYAVDRRSGRFQWAHKMDAYGGSHVRHADGRIYAKSSRTLYCIDAIRGTQHWSFSPLPGRETIYSAPCIHHHRLFIGDRAGVFHCLDARTGEGLWRQQVSSEKNNQVNATAAIHGDLVVTSCNAAVVVAYDISTGREIWRQSTDGPCISEVLAHAGHIFVSTTSSIYALDAATGDVVLTKSWPLLMVRAVALCRDSITAVLTSAPSRERGATAQLLAFDTNAERFQLPTAEFIVGIRFDSETGLLYESRIDGLGIVDPATGRRLHNIFSEAVMLNCGLVDVVDGMIYLLESDGGLYCLRQP